MIEIGKIQELEIAKRVDFGVYLKSPEDSQTMVLLPVKQVPEAAEVGSLLSVFVYRDSEDRMIATVHTPKMTLGKTALCKVVSVSDIGSFLDWGLEKDLFLPFREQTRRIAQGEECLVALYEDKSGRLAATMNVYPYLEVESDYGPDDEVLGMVYQVSQEFGAFVAVDNRYSALVPRKELVQKLRAGDTVTARVSMVKPDGKLELSLRQKAHLQIYHDAEFLLAKLGQNGGKLLFTDKSDPELIRETFHMSKKEFKRAVGHLLKTRKIKLLPEGIWPVK